MDESCGQNRNKNKKIDNLFLELGQSIDTVSFNMESNLRPRSEFNLHLFKTQNQKFSDFI